MGRAIVRLVLPVLASMAACATPIEIPLNEGGPPPAADIGVVKTSDSGQQKNRPPDSGGGGGGFDLSLSPPGGPDSGIRHPEDDMSDGHPSPAPDDAGAADGDGDGLILSDAMAFDGPEVDGQPDADGSGATDVGAPDKDADIADGT